MTRMILLSPLLFCAACAKTRDPAPEDVDGLSIWLFRNFEDPEALAEGMNNLTTWLDVEGRTEEATEGFVLSDLTEEDVAAVTHPDRDLVVQIGVAVPGVSPWPLSGHAELITRADQLWNDHSYDVYTREIVEGDADTWLSTHTGVIATKNTIDKSGGFGVHIPYILFKDFAWVTLPDDREAVVARSWIEESACAEGGSNCLWQSFSVDLWYGPNTDETIRMTSSWNELQTTADSFLTDEQRIGLMVNGVHDIFENTDAVLAEEP